MEEDKEKETNNSKEIEQSSKPPKLEPEVPNSRNEVSRKSKTLAEDKKEEKKHEVKPEIKVDIKKRHGADIKKHHAKSQKPFQLKVKKTTMWQAAAVILGVLLIFSLTSNKCDGPGGDVVSVNAAGQKTTSFISTVLLEGQQEATLKGVTEESNMYRVDFEVDGSEYPAYVSSDGKLLFLQQALNMDEMTAETTAEPAVPDVTKADKPEVELFVMSHCPYGTQVEKGILPVAELLGNKIDFSIKFVYYAMHGMTEIDEQLNQYCIQKEFKDKYIDYLNCFLGEGEGGKCLEETGIDTAALEACVEETDEELNITGKFEDKSTWLNGRFPLFDVDKELNNQYDVKGSPHLVINGDTVSSSRDPASILAAVCASFNDAPEECDTQLSSASPSPGFGFEETGGSDSATCE